MKVTAIINSTEQANNIKDLVQAFILPIESFSINYDKTFNIEEIKKIKQTKKEIFVAINKNIHNNELQELEKILKKLDILNINGILFYDIALINLKQKLNLKTPLVWAQEHLTTNYGTVNFWYEKGAKYVYLSSEITKEEYKEIKENTKAKIFINVFGYIPMFTSRRHLVNNYINHFELADNSKQKTIYKEEKYYPITDKENGTTVYSNYILNALDETFNVDYIVFNSYLINEEDFKDTLINYKEKTNKYKFPFNHGFLYKETIYKVKNNE